MTTADRIAIIVNIITLAFLGAQVWYAQRAIKDSAQAQREDTERQRKQASIEMMVSTSEYRERLKSDLPWNDRDPQVVADFLAEANGDYMRLTPLREYLNHLEDLSVGTLRGVYDEDIVGILEGRRIIDAVRSYRPYIDWVRETLKRPLIYEDILDLAQRMEVVVARLDNERESQVVRAGEAAVAGRRWWSWRLPRPSGQ